MTSIFPRHLRGVIVKQYVCDPEPLSGKGGKVPHPVSLAANGTVESDLVLRKRPHETVKIRQCHELAKIKGYEPAVN
jgi:hypothetical protein